MLRRHFPDCACGIRPGHGRPCLRNSIHGDGVASCCHSEFTRARSGRRGSNAPTRSSHVPLPERVFKIAPTRIGISPRCPLLRGGFPETPIPIRPDVASTLPEKPLGAALERTGDTSRRGGLFRHWLPGGGQLWFQRSRIRFPDQCRQCSRHASKVAKPSRHVTPGAHARLGANHPNAPERRSIPRGSRNPTAFHPPAPDDAGKGCAAAGHSRQADRGRSHGPPRPAGRYRIHGASWRFAIWQWRKRMAMDSRKRSGSGPMTRFQAFRAT